MGEDIPIGFAVALPKLGGDVMGTETGDDRERLEPSPAGVFTWEFVRWREADVSAGIEWVVHLLRERERDDEFDPDPMIPSFHAIAGMEEFMLALIDRLAEVTSTDAWSVVGEVGVECMKPVEELAARTERNFGSRREFLDNDGQHIGDAGAAISRFFDGVRPDE